MLIIIKNDTLHEFNQPTRRHRATEHPSVPDPKSKHFVCFTFSKSISATTRHFINFKFRSTAFSANLKIISKITPILLQ